MKKLVFLPIFAVAVVGSSGCGLRNSYQNQKQKQADVAAAHTHDQTIALDASDANKQLVDFNAHRNYDSAIVAEYDGTYTAVNTDGNSEFMNDVQGLINTASVKHTLSVQIELSNDFVQFTNTPPLTVDEVRTQTDALAFTITTNDIASGVDSSGNETTLPTTCVNPNMKPDYEMGTLTFTCTGKTYTLSVDDTTMSPHLERSPENTSRISAQVSAEVRAGTITQIGLMNVKIVAADQELFFGKLTRKTPEKN